jgi:hypothetical protein
MAPLTRLFTLPGRGLPPLAHKMPTSATRRPQAGDIPPGGSTRRDSRRDGPMPYEAREREATPVQTTAKPQRNGGGNVGGPAPGRNLNPAPQGRNCGKT